MSIINLLQHTKPPISLKNLPEVYNHLVDALQTQDAQSVKDHLQKIPRAEHLDPKIIGIFIDHFSAQTMGVLFEYPVGSREFSSIVSASSVASEDVWRWFIDERQLPVSYLVSQCVDRLQDSFLTPKQQQSVVHFFAAAMQQIETREIEVSDFLAHIAPVLKSPCVENWDACLWTFFSTFPHQHWQELLQTIDMDDLLHPNDCVSYAYLSHSLQHIAPFQESFDQRFSNLEKRYLEFVRNFSAPEGMQHSLGFKQLPRAVQKELRNDIADLYDENDGVSFLGAYKKLLGYTNDDLFLKTFGFNELDTSYSSPVLDDFFHHGLQPIHPLHIILQTPQGFLHFGSNATDLIVQHLDHPLILQNVFDEMDPNLFLQMLEQHPQLAHWKDAKGNSLGHWCMVHRSLNKEWVDVLTRYPPLLEPNHAGHTLRDIVVQDMNEEHAEASDLAALDHILISRAVCDATVATNHRRKI